MPNLLFKLGLKKIIYKKQIFSLFLISFLLFVASKYVGINFQYLNIDKSFFFYNTKLLNINIPYYLFFCTYSLFLIIYFSENKLNIYEIIFLLIVLLFSFFLKNHGYLFFAVNYFFFKFFFQNNIDIKKLKIIYQILIVVSLFIVFQKYLDSKGIYYTELPIHFSTVTNSISYLLFYTFIAQIFYLIKLNKIDYSILITFFLIIFIANSFIKMLSFISLTIYFLYFIFNMRFRYLFNYNFKLFLILLVALVFFVPLYFTSSYFIDLIHNFYLLLLKIHSNFFGISEKKGCDELVDKLLYNSEYLSRSLQLKYPILCYNYTGEPPFYGIWIGFLERIQILKDFLFLNFSKNFELNDMINKFELNSYSHNSYINLVVVFNPLTFLFIFLSKIFFIIFFLRRIHLIQFMLVALILISHLTDDYFYANRAEISFISFMLLGILLNQKNKV